MLAAPIIRTPSLGFLVEQSYICSPRRSTTLPGPVATNNIFRERVHQITEHLSKSTTSFVKPTQQESSRDTATLRLRGAQDDQILAMTTEKGAEPNAYPASNRKDEDKPSEEKPAQQATTVDIDADVEDKYNQLPPLPSPPLEPHPQFVHCVPPEAPTYREYSVFLAGSIEMGKAIQWQKCIATFLSTLPITVNNPRRGHWDPNVTKEAKDEAFRHQVEWELSALEKADVICFFLDVNTMSPVTMLELGLWAHSKKVVVCCDKRFWRAGNIHIVCERYNIPFVETFQDLVPAIKKMLGEKGMKLDENGDLIK